MPRKPKPPKPIEPAPEPTPEPTPEPPPEPTPVGTIYDAPSSLDVTGNTDCTAALLAWVASVPNGTATNPSVLRFPAGATYRLDKSAKFTNRHYLSFIGNGALFERKTKVEPLPANGYPHWSFIGGSNISMTGMKVKGLNTVSGIDMNSAVAALMFEPEKFGGHWSDRAFEFGFGFQGTKGVNISNLEVDAVFGDGLILGGEHASTYLTTDVTATNITIDRNGRQGVAIISTERVLLDNVKVLHSYSTGMDLEIIATDGRMSDIEIRNCYINARSVALAHSSVGGRNVHIHDNHIKFSSPSRPWLDMPNQSTQTEYLAFPKVNWWIANNRVDSLQEEIEGIRLWNVQGATISGNTSHEKPPPLARANAVLKAVNLMRCSGAITINGNDFTGNTIVYAKDAATGAVSACGNRLVAGGLWNQPTVCS